MKDALISVIIPTLNRKAVLESLLPLIIKTQTYHKFELIIIDQSDIYDKQEENKVLSKIANGVPIKYIPVEFKSLTLARNKGIDNAAGDIILFLDDDVKPSPELFTQHLISYDISEDIGCVTGWVIEGPGSNINTKRAGGYVSFTGRVFRNFDSPCDGFVYSAQGCNMSFKKSVIDAVGYFDTRFIGTAQYEEADYCYRVRQNGYQIFYNGKAFLEHLLDPKGGCRDTSFKRIYFLFHNAGLFYAKHKLPILFPVSVLFQSLRVIKKVFLLHESIKSRFYLSFMVIRGIMEGYLEERKNPLYVLLSKTLPEYDADKLENSNKN